MTIPPRAPNIPPFLGNALNFAFSPHTFLVRLVENYGDVVNFDLVGANTYLIAHPEAIHDVLIRKQHAFTKSLRSRRILGQTMGTGLLTSVDAYHTRQRHLMQPAFHDLRLQRYVDTIVSFTHKHIAGWQPHQMYDMRHEMVTLTTAIIFKTLLGLDVTDDAQTIQQAFTTLMTACNDRLLNPVATVMRKYFQHGQKETTMARATVNDFIMRIVAERRAQGTPDTGDLLSILFLLSDEHGDQMTDKEVHDEAISLFAAGYETTATLVTWTWYVLSQYPEIKHKFYDEVESVSDTSPPVLGDLRNQTYTNMLLKEVLRYYPPTWMMTTRICIEDVEVGGYAIPDYADILISPYIMHRNPRWWDDVHTLKPERFSPENEQQLHPYQYIPFGAGEHHCIGHRFALMIAQLILMTIARHYDLELAMSSVSEKASATLMPRDGLKMCVIPRT